MPKIQWHQLTKCEHLGVLAVLYNVAQLMQQLSMKPRVSASTPRSSWPHVKVSSDKTLKKKT